MTDAELIAAISRLLDQAGAPRGLPLLMRIQWLINQLSMAWG